MLNGLDLFSGIGGLTKALAPWVRPIAYCENDKYAVGVLLSRMWKGDLPTAPIHTDIKDLHGEDLEPIKIDIVYGGSPCQGLSQAGLRKGLDDERSGLFYELVRVVRETEPTWIFWENVGRTKRQDLLEASRAIRNLGYTVRAGAIAAMEIGAKHARRRIFILAHANGIGGKGGDYERESGRRTIEEENGIEKASRHHNAKPQGNWEACADSIYREHYGISNAVDRLRGLGNAVVPLQAREAFKRLMGL